MKKENKTTIKKSWFDSIENWNELPHFQDKERIPKLKEFIIQLYTNKEWNSEKFLQEIPKLKRKIDQILRQQFEIFKEFSKTECKDINSLLPGFNTISLNNYFDNKLGHYQKEILIGAEIIKIIKSLLNQHAQDYRINLTREKVKKEENILKNIKFPCTIKFKSKKIKFNSKEEFDENVFYESNYKIVGKSLKEKNEMINLLKEFDKFIEGNKK